MTSTLRVFLFKNARNAGRPVFYADPTGASDVRPHAGLRGKVEAWLRRLETRWRNARGITARWSHQLWDWLHRRAHPDEALLARLRSAEYVELHYAEPLAADDVKAAWATYLAEGRRRHLPWFVVNVLVVPLATMLFVLPGPNLVGYWFAYRSIHHALILYGLRRARKGRVEVRLKPTPLLVRGGSEDLAGLGCDPEAVDQFLQNRGARGPVETREPA